MLDFSYFPVKRNLLNNFLLITRQTLHQQLSFMITITKGIVMSWQVELYEGVEDQILAMPAKIQARVIHLLELMEAHGALI